MSKKVSLFHGSENVVSSPMFGYGKTNNDYGRGFYCTRNLELAKEWACQKNKDGYVNIYEIDIDGLNILNLNSEEYTILHWISTLIKNRDLDEVENEEACEFLLNKFSVDMSNTDMVVGYRADDSYFTYAKDFVNDAITIQSLEKAMTLGKLGLQTMIKSEKAFERLKFTQAQAVLKETYYSRFKQRDTAARSTYQELRKLPKSQGIIITEIIKNPELLYSHEKERRKKVKPISLDEYFSR